VRLVSLKEFRSIVFSAESAPSVATLRMNINKIAGGCKMLGRYYVDIDEYNRVTQLSAKVEETIERLSKTPELEGLL
jgi:hypothetical protein